MPMDVWDGADVDKLLVGFWRQVVRDLASRRASTAGAARAWLASDEARRWLGLSFPNQEPDHLRGLLVEGRARRADRRAPTP